MNFGVPFADPLTSPRHVHGHHIDSVDVCSRSSLASPTAQL
jgi:hypothetical protein